MAHDAIQAIKQLRRDVVDAMRALMKLAKDKQTSGMLPICEDMITKTRILLSLWDPGLVEEALTFLEEYKVAKVHETSNENSLNLDFKTNQSLSPFKRITQQLNFDLKSPDFDDFVTPDTPECVRDLWTKENEKNGYTASFPSKNEHVHVNHRVNTTNQDNVTDGKDEENFVIFPDVENDAKNMEIMDTCAETSTSGNVNDDADGIDDSGNDPVVSDDTILATNASKCEDNEEREADIKGDIDPCKRFLDTQKMCNSPSANYYKPTDEPEPWDLTQLNIEASVMCLVSKVKFLCGRCSSPAVRLRNKNIVGRSHSLKGCAPANRNKTVHVVTIQPKTDIKNNDESSKLLDTSVENRSNFRQQPSPGSEKIPAFSKAKEGKETRLSIILRNFDSYRLTSVSIA